MSIVAEEYRAADLAGVAGESMPTVDRLSRGRSGGWTFRFRLVGEATLPDGRRVAVNRHVQVRATEQIGRKPRIVGA